MVRSVEIMGKLVLASPLRRRVLCHLKILGHYLQPIANARGFILAHICLGFDEFV